MRSRKRMMLWKNLTGRLKGINNKKPAARAYIFHFSENKSSSNGIGLVFVLSKK